MAKMTKADINKRQLDILAKLDEMDEKTNVREAKMRTLTSEEQKGTITEDKISELESGAAIYPDKSELTAPAILKIVERKSLIEIKHLLSGEDEKLTRKKGETPVFSGLLTITEGKKHQVKKMAKSVGLTVVYLERIAICGVFLDKDLPRGKFRPLSNAELETIFAMSNTDTDKVSRSNLQDIKLFDFTDSDPTNVDDIVDLSNKIILNDIQKI